ncbi:hypothetical protein [Couchioplanes caeruleus]|uniref:Lipoprotein n=1 Tax=Couchioplanes caeruleus TaxID=56438 RepID=A0A3N1GNF0_9ACTN|nr:hypothetical protein [Couchioplanes caeruleus]ROP31636.1 hypothetical protein EDD30_4558 [Couchioplanes caeruleus]
MRLRHAAPVLAALTLLGLAACGDDPDDKGTPPPVPPAVSVGASPAAASGGTPGASGRPASPQDAPTEGTSSQRPPKKDGGALQGPVGRSVAPR